MRRGVSGRRGGLRRQQLVVGFIIVIALILVAATTVQRRGRGEPGGVVGADPANAAQVALGREIYGTRCASCHGADLAGQLGWEPSLTGGSLLAPPLDATGPSPQRTDAWLFAVIREGGAGVAPQGAVSAMPAFSGLSDAQIWALVAYMKSTWPPEVRAAQP